MAIAKLRKKKPKSQAHMAPPDIPPSGVGAPQEINARAIYVIIRTANMIFTSSQGDLNNLFISTSLFL
jgi:hypothetical protein